MKRVIYTPLAIGIVAGLGLSGCATWTTAPSGGAYVSGPATTTPLPLANSATVRNGLSSPNGFY